MYPSQTGVPGIVWWERGSAWGGLGAQAAVCPWVSPLLSLGTSPLWRGCQCALDAAGLSPLSPPPPGAQVIYGFSLPGAD